MTKSIIINLAKVTYRGTSIGRDIQIDIKILGQSFKLTKRINVNETKEMNQYLGTFETKSDIFNPDIIITVTENDFFFSESSTVKEPLHVATASGEFQFFSFTVKVGETRSWWKRIIWGSREATFEVQLGARVSTETSVIRKYSYSGIRGDENYNRYDDFIVEMVDYWNNEFARDTNPPTELLDPSLVKAIMYQESRIGYFESVGVDVMQVGHPQDPALRTLQGGLKEYWIHNGEQLLLKYDARVDTVKDSIKWGVRWLYHNAQGIGNDGHRYWRTWKEAMYEYGPHTKKYVEDVWSIYKNGVRKEENSTTHLWIIALFFPFIVFPLLGNLKVKDIKSAILSSFDNQKVQEIDGIQITSSKINTSLFAAVIENEKDWWEDLKIGIWNNKQIRWFNIESAPREQSILSVRFVNLAGLNKDLLEVYGQTHMGNGNLYIYEIIDDIAHLILETSAVDIYYDSIWSEENLKKYGYGTCGETYKGGGLTANYDDINQDGIVDITLSGIQFIDCEHIYNKEGVTYSERIRVAEVPIIKHYTLTQ